MADDPAARYRRYSCAIFDCDGVILDSNAVKIQAFRDALAGYDPAVVEAFIEEHRRSGGVSRYAKLRRFFTELVEVEEPEAALAAAIEAFSASARAGLRSCSEVPGVRVVIEALAEERVPIHVVSGGDEDEVSEVLLARGYGPLLTDIHGSPMGKREHLERLRSEGELHPGGVFFGDARLDMELAEDFGLSFVFVAGVSDWPEGRELAVARGHELIEDFEARP